MSFAVIRRQLKGRPAFFRRYSTNQKAHTSSAHDHLEKVLHPFRYWSNPQHRWRVLEQLRTSLLTEQKAQEHSYSVLYPLTKESIRNLSTYMLSIYNDSVSLMVCTEYPSHAWNVWEFKKTPQNWWRDVVHLVERNDIVAMECLRNYIEHQCDYVSLVSLRQTNQFDKILSVIISAVAHDRTLTLHFADVTALIHKLYNAPPNNDLNIGATQSTTVPPYLPALENPFFFESQSNRRQFLQFIQAHLGGTYEDLYNVSRRILIQAGGKRLLEKHNDSPSQVIMKEIPEHQWFVWKFKHTPRNYWNMLANKFYSGDPSAIATVRSILDDLKSQMNAKSDRDLLGARLDSTLARRFDFFGGLDAIINHFTSLDTTSSHVQGDGSEVSVHKPGVTINTQDNFDAFQHPTSWYSYLNRAFGVTYSTRYKDLYPLAVGSRFVRTGGAVLLHTFNSCPTSIFQTLFPLHTWLPWRFPVTPRHWWDQLIELLQAGDCVAETIARIYVEEISDKLSLSDRALNSIDFVHRKLKAAGVEVPWRQNALSTLLQHIMSENVQTDLSSTPTLHSIRDSKDYKLGLSRIPKKWKAAKNRRHFLDVLCSFSTHDYNRAYDITDTILRQNGGSALLKEYDSQIALMIMTEYPEHAWQQWRFNKYKHKWISLLCNALEAGDIVAQTSFEQYLQELMSEEGGESLMHREQKRLSALLRLDQQHSSELDRLIALYRTYSRNVAHMTQTSIQRKLARDVHTIFPPNS